VLSPSTERIDRSKKLRIYAREGVKHAWLLNPITRTLEVFRLAEGRWLLVATHAEAEKVRAEPFDQVDLDLSALWSEPAAE
jgi:Uma2 family endonuclease